MFAKTINILVSCFPQMNEINKPVNQTVFVFVSRGNKHRNSKRAYTVQFSVFV